MVVNRVRANNHSPLHVHSSCYTIRMKLSWLRMFQWISILAALVFAVALRYEAPSEAGMRMNASVESPLSQGMRGYWKLDTGSGTSAVDSSGNGNTLSMTGSPSWTTGNIGPYALDFSGSGQYLSVADPSSGVLDFADGADFSISGWFNRDTFTADHTIVAKKTNQTTNAGYVVWIDASTDTVNFEISDGTDTYEADSTTAFTATGWHHFVAVWDDSNGAYVYIDGGLSGSTTSSTSSIGDLSNTNAFRIGAESDAGVPFDGKLDDIRIYGYALSADQVKKIYNTTSPTQPVDTSLVGHWTFDGPDIQGSTAIDRSSFGNNGTISGATKTIGKLGQALNFGTDDIYLAIGTTNYNPTSGYSVAFWMKANATGASEQQILGEYGPSWEPMLTFISHGTNKLDIFLRDDSNTALISHRLSTTVVFNDVWHHVVWTDYGGSVALYIDAEPDATNFDYTPTTLTLSYTRVGDGRNSSDDYRGSLDDIRFYNRTLSASEVANLYGLGR